MLCGAAGIQPPKDVILDGFNMASILAGNPRVFLSKTRAGARKEMFWQRRGDKAARVGNWKWVESSRDSGLFDLSKDIGEQYDLSKEKPEVLRMVKSRFSAWEQLMAEAEPRGPFRDF